MIEKTQERIIIISLGYFPKQSPRAFRWTALAEYWANAGKEVHVLCTQMPACANYALHNKVHVHRVGYGNLMDLIYSIFKIQKRRDQASRSVETHKTQNSWLGKALYFFNTLFWRSIYWPDGACIWYFPARKALRRLLKTVSFDRMISVSLPFTAHLVALDGKRQQPALEWIVDIGDPFAFLKEAPKNNLVLYRRLNFRVERKILDQADAISVTVKETKNQYESHYESLSTPITIIPPLFAPQKPEPVDRSFFDPSKISIAYFGTFYYGIRTPAHFLFLLDAYLEAYPSFEEKIEVCFFGEITGALKDAFNQYNSAKKCCKVYHQIPRANALFLMREADILLNISNKTSYQLPSKSIDYLMAGKPILNICYSEQDTFKQFFIDYSNICNVIWEEPISDMTLETFHNFILRTDALTDPKLVQELAAPYQIDAIAAQYQALTRRRRQQG